MEEKYIIIEDEHESFLKKRDEIKKRETELA
jgi:hypothetical protein